MKIRLIIADDQKIIRQSLRIIIEKNSNDIEVIETVANGREAYEACLSLAPDIILMDISMPECDGIKATRLIKDHFPQVKILILSSSSDEINVYDAIRSGADGYIFKDVGKDELLLSIYSTAAGLGIIQREILHTVASVKKDKSPARENVISVNGIEVRLTDRQIHIIKLIIDGLDNKQIASKLFIAEGTVKNIITEIISQLQCKDKTQLAVFALKNNLV